MDDLLADLEARAAARERAEGRAEGAEAVRAERAVVTLSDRLRASTGQVVGVTACGAARRGRLLEVGHGWVALSRANAAFPVLDLRDLVRPGVSVVVTDAIESVTGCAAHLQSDDSSGVGRALSSLLRAAARGRTNVSWMTRSGSTHAGVVEAVGRDHAILSQHGSDPVIVTLAGLAVMEPMTGRPEHPAIRNRR